MSFQYPETYKRPPRSIINLQDRCSTGIMDVRARKMVGTTATNAHPASILTRRVEKKSMEYHRSPSGGNARRLFTFSHFSLVSMLLLVSLIVSLLILPLILPPLPPPPLMLLLLPIFILALLMILAFIPSHAKDVGYTYV